jgi:hypothetical protein
MRVIRGEPVEVWLRDGRPARFVWRGRMYTVIFVVDRRLITLAEPAREVGAEPTPGVLADPTPGVPAEPMPGVPAGPTAAVAAEPAEPVGAEPTEPNMSAADGRECWLVEATPERALPPTRYELCHDLPSDRWSLSRG